MLKKNNQMMNKTKIAKSTKNSPQAENSDQLLLENKNTWRDGSF